MAVVNWLTPLIIPPRMMSRMDYSRGIVPEFPTMVVVPTMLGDAATAVDLLERLEVHYVSNRDDHLYFALLTDFTDASAETLPEDAVALQAGNRRHQTPESAVRFRRPSTVFSLPSPAPLEQIRRKMDGLRAQARQAGGVQCRCCAAATATDFSRSSAIGTSCRTIRFVDHAGHRHPVAARCRPPTGRHDGPSAEPAAVRCRNGLRHRRLRHSAAARRRESAQRQPFLVCQLFAGDAGIDPYTRVVSDVYQDLFQEGSFIGKGIYDVDAFEQTLAGRFPRTAILSHDLIEGCYARSGLVSDIRALRRIIPSHYNADISRRHRWIRGDWQIAHVAPAARAGPDGRPLRIRSRGCRAGRSSTTCAAAWCRPRALLLLLGMDRSAGARRSGRLLVLRDLSCCRLFCDRSCELVPQAADLPPGLHLHGLWHRSLGASWARRVVTLVFLPYDAFVSLDAIVRTLLRMVVTRRRLLEWETASDAQRGPHTDLSAASYRTMWIAPLMLVAHAAILLIVSAPR